MSVRNIAFQRRCFTATVGKVVDQAKARGLEWLLPEEMSDAAIRAVIYPCKPKTDAAKAEPLVYVGQGKRLPCPVMR